MEKKDVDAVRMIYEQAGYDFVFPDFDSPLIEAWDVLVGDDDVPVMAAAAKRSLELYLFSVPGGAMHPTVKMEGIKMLHESMRDKIVSKGYSEATAFLPPELERTHGRHLMRKFGWLKSWAGFVIRDWKGGSVCPKA